MLSQHHASEDRPASQRICARCGSSVGDDTSIRAIAQTSEEGRDAVRSPQRILRLDRLRLRGLKGARDEFLLAATAQNLRRMAAWLMPKGPKAGIAVPI